MGSGRASGGSRCQAQASAEMSEFANRQGWDTEEVASCFQVTEEALFYFQVRDKGLEAALGCAHGL